MPQRRSEENGVKRGGFVIGKKFLCLALAILSGTFATVGCSENSTEKTVIGKFEQSDYLKVVGTQVKKDYGNGQEVKLRGTNAGGYLLIEQWMTAVNSLDHKTATESFTKRFGEETTQDIWAAYRDNFWSEQDFVNCANMGMTVIRLPFSYMNVDFNGQYDFGQLDEFIEGAAKYGIYTILDLHGAYGSQNGRDHSGEVVSSVNDRDFYRNEIKKSKTVALWRALAEHYLDNPAVAAFDLLNEPAEDEGPGNVTSERHWEFYDRLYDAVREVDEDRIIIFESCWSATNLPSPDVYGWENCIYSYHLYADNDGVAAQGPAYEKLINDVKAADYGVPNYMGEFCCYKYEDAWEYVLKLMNDNGWHWTNWGYKGNGNLTGWGIYVTKAQRVNPAVNELELIYERFKDISTASELTTLTRFQSGKTLAEIIKEACKTN